MQENPDMTLSESAQEPDEVVAVTLYSKQTSIENRGFYRGIFDKTTQNDLARLKNGLIAAALSKGKTPPRMELTLYLVPKADEQQHHDSIEYLETKVQLLKTAKDCFGASFIIRDFLVDSQVTTDELEFLYDCKSTGSIADIMKSRAIIDNKGKACLQTDSNTTWANNNFEDLYNITFNLNEDAFNSSRCSDFFVSTHNKVVFTSSTSRFPDILQTKLIQYCQTFKDNPIHKTARFNGVYDMPFCQAAHEYGLSYRVRVNNKYIPGETWDYYPGKLTDPRYKLMRLIIACQRESWRAKDGPPQDASECELEGNLKLPSGEAVPAITVHINDVEYEYYHYKSLVRVFTNIPSWHTEQNTHNYLDDTHDYFIDAQEARNIFVAQQDTVLCMQVLGGYYNAVRRRAANEDGEGTFEAKNNNHLMLLARLIPNTSAGNNLCQELFHCSVVELYKNPIRLAKIPAAPVPSNYSERFQLQAKDTYTQFTENLIRQLFDAEHIIGNDDIKSDLELIVSSIRNDKIQFTGTFGPEKETLFQIALKYKWKQVYQACVDEKIQTLDYKNLAYLIIYGDADDANLAISNLQLSDNLEPPLKNQNHILQLAVLNNKFRHISDLLNLPSIDMHTLKGLMGVVPKSLVSSEWLMKIVASKVNLAPFAENLVQLGVRVDSSIILNHPNVNLLLASLDYKNLCAMANLACNAPISIEIFAKSEILNLESQPQSPATNRKITKIKEALGKAYYLREHAVLNALGDQSGTDLPFFAASNKRTEAQDRFTAAISPVLQTNQLNPDF